MTRVRPALLLLALSFELSAFPLFAFEAKTPDGWVRRELTVAGLPTVRFLQPAPEGEYRLEVYAYARANPFHLTRKTFVSGLEARAKRPAARIKAGAKDAAVFKALPVHDSAWSAVHADPDEAVLGASGGDFSAKRKLERCREQGAWKTYAWYRDAYEKRSDAALFRKHFGDREAKVVEVCLGRERLLDIRQNRTPDAAVTEPDDAALAALAADLEKERARPAREESFYTEPAKDGGFYVLRYESPAGKHDKNFPAYLLFIASFKP